MKINYKYLLLLVPIGILIYSHYYLTQKSNISFDFYKLVPNYYLNKIDYFSDYSVVKKVNDHFETVLNNVESLGKTENGIYINTSIGSENKIVFFSNNNDSQPDSMTADKFSKEFTKHKIKWMEPWQFVENSTLHNKLKLLNQIIILAIIILSLFFIKKFLSLQFWPNKSLK
jgi:hypothetical protein